jgi:glycosyltransferase involved in cell wall biosynthesis
VLSPETGPADEARVPAASIAAARPQKVLLFGSYAPSLIHFRGRLIADLIGRGHSVTAMAPAIDDDTEAALRSLGATPVSVALGKTSINPLEWLRAGRGLRPVLRSLKADVLIAYTIKPIVVGVPAARAAGVKRTVALVTGLGYAFTGGREPIRLISRAAAAFLYRRAFLKTDVAVFQNENDRRDFARIGVLPAKVKTSLVNGSGVDLDHYASSPPPTKASFLMIARLLGDKGVREYGEAARRLKQIYPEARISLLGGIGTEPDAVSRAELDRFRGWGVDYLGLHDDVRPFIAAHSVYVLPSYREGTPRSVLEALSTGRAVITTDAPGCRQTVEPGRNGLLVPPRDADALFEAMRHFIENPQVIGPMGAASRQIAEDRYDVRKVNAALLAAIGL